MADNHRQSIDKVVDFLRGRWPDTALNADVESRVRARVPAFARR